MAQTQTANGLRVSETFVVNIRLDNGVMFTPVQVTLADLAPDTDALIGMDIITIGDFSVTNFRGTTVMSFRTPSLSEVDFVRQINTQNQRGAPKFRPGPPQKKKRR